MLKKIFHTINAKLRSVSRSQKKTDDALSINRLLGGLSTSLDAAYNRQARALAWHSIRTLQARLLTIKR